jgi:hypothetical protein
MLGKNKEFSIEIELLLNDKYSNPEISPIFTNSRSYPGIKSEFEENTIGNNGNSTGQL